MKINRISLLLRNKSCLWRLALVSSSAMHRIIFYLLSFILLSFTFSYALNLDTLKTYFLGGDYKAAITEGERIMADAEEAPDLDELYYILGVSYLKDGNYLRASDIFEIILKEFKGSVFSPDAKLGLGDTYFLRQDYVKAKAHYQELLNESDNGRLLPLVYQRLGQCALKLGETDEAKSYLATMQQKYPGYLQMDESGAANPASVNFYAVQVGSFSKKKNAENLTQKLAGNGYPAYAEEAAARGIVSYRVRVGKFNSRKEAQEMESKLAQEGYPAKICP